MEAGRITNKQGKILHVSPLESTPDFGHLPVFFMALLGHLLFAGNHKLVEKAGIDS